MSKVQRAEEGFTLVELLIVLAIFSMLTVFVFSMLFRFYDKNIYEQAVERFRWTLHYAQQTAMAEQMEVRVYVEDNGAISARYGHQQILQQWTLPERMAIHISTGNQILFKLNGNVSQIGSITIVTPYSSEKYSINLSKGRLRAIE